MSDSQRLWPLQPFGIQVDEARNEAAVGVEADIQASTSRVKLLVIPTDEELSIAQQALEVVRAAETSPEQ